MLKTLVILARQDGESKADLYIPYCKHVSKVFDQIIKISKKDDIVQFKIKGE